MDKFASSKRFLLKAGFIYFIFCSIVIIARGQTLVDTIVNEIAAKQYVQLIRCLNDGYDNNQFYNFRFLQQFAADSTIIGLTNHSSSSVKTCALLILIQRNPDKSDSVFTEALKSGEYVTVKSCGCCSLYDEIYSVIYYEVLKNLNFDHTHPTLSQMDSIILHYKPQPSNYSLLLGQNKLSNHNDSIIRTLAFKTHDLQSLQYVDTFHSIRYDSRLKEEYLLLLKKKQWKKLYHHEKLFLIERLLKYQDDAITKKAIETLTKRRINSNELVEFTAILRSYQVSEEIIAKLYDHHKRL